MSAARHQAMTLESFLDWESRQEARFEFDGVHPVAMNGGPWGHWVIQRNLMDLLINGLRGQRCQPCSAGMKIRTAKGIRYPDAFVVCSPVKPDAAIVDDPAIVFEILSPSAAPVDVFDKNQEYRDTPSIQRYVILEQTGPGATVFSRQGDNWIGSLHIGETILELPEIGLSVPLTALYAGALDEGA